MNDEEFDDGGIAEREKFRTAERERRYHEKTVSLREDDEDRSPLNFG